MSPRRSSRARTTQPSPALLQHTNSSGSSTSLTRGERSTRSNQKLSSPRRSSVNRSQSTDDPDSGSKNDFPQTRRQRTRGEDNEEAIPAVSDEEDEEDGEEEEITRCLCGQQEYPGLPPSRREALGRQGSKLRGKDDPVLKDVSDPLNDEIGSMFIQCDSCKVWQHGGCVGIMDEDMSPDEYFCEQCRKDLHKITNEPDGSRSSQYLPVVPSPSPAPSSRDSSRDVSKRSRDSKSRQSEAPPKRRSTYNSRDAGYNEEEELRRALEMSKEETKTSQDDAGNRRPKRGRSDSETNKIAKRQRTKSPSPSSLSKKSNSLSQPDSDDESKPKSNGGTKKQRGTATRQQREKDYKDTDEAEIDRNDLTDKRKVDDPELEAASPTKPTPNDPETSDPTPGTPSQTQEPLSRPSTRRTGRPPARRGGRVGRNQYTRDREGINSNGSETNHSPHSPHGGNATGRDSPNGNGPNGVSVNGESVKPSKPRYLNPNRTSMLDMKRRVAAILEFISRMQVEMAVSGEVSTTPPNGNGSSKPLPVKGVREQLGTLIQANKTDTGNPSGGEASIDGSVSLGDSESLVDGISKDRDFKDLSSLEMMDALTRDALKWQQQWGKHGEKS